MFNNDFKNLLNLKSVFKTMFRSVFIQCIFSKSVFLKNILKRIAYKMFFEKIL